MVQDDTNVLAFLDDTQGAVDLLLLARGADGRRQFDDERGNKSFKLDLEAAVVLKRADEEVLLCLGSGSTRARETIVSVRRRDGALEARAHDARLLYAHLRAVAAFSGSELNVEGATCVGDRVVLFQRGNGAPKGDLEAIDATGTLDAEKLHGYIEGSAPTPVLGAVSSYDLGRVNGARLTFTDATADGDEVYFVAAAEDSPDATRDGPVTGVALGCLHSNGEVGYALVKDERGEPLTDKVEGVCCDGPGRFLAVVDRDDPAAPSQMLTIELLRS